MRPWVLLGLSVVVATGVVWAAVDDGDERDALPKVDAVRDCRTHVEGRLPAADPRRDLIVGPIRFRGFRDRSRFALRERGRGFYEIRNREYHGEKLVTEVRAGADVTIAIADENRATAGFLYDRSLNYGRHGIPFQEAEQAVRFRACTADHPAGHPRFYGRRTVGPWTQFNGGMLFTRAQCLRLDLYERGKPVRHYAEPFGRSSAGCRPRT